jgi:hypothetical protein
MTLASPSLSRAQVSAMRCLMIDSVTVDVVERFHAAGVQTLLLKGASIGRWLYPDGEQRTYGDADLLVSPENFDHAERLLRQSGFRHRLAGATAEEMTSTHAWVSPGVERVTVELHRTFHHIAASDDEVWRELSRGTETIAVGGARVEIPGEAARCLLLALHVSRHGREFEWPLRDLELAVQRVPTDVWSHAVEIARRLDALPGMVSGLHVIPEGEELRRALGLPIDGVSAALVIEAENMPKVTRNLERLAVTEGLGAKVAFASRKLFPTAAYMRYEYRLGDCGTARLAGAYAARLLHLLRDLPASLLAWSRARRQAARLGAR